MEVEISNEAMEEIEELKRKEITSFGWSWDDDNLLGNFWIECLCGKKEEVDTHGIGKVAVCSCGRKYMVERKTKCYLIKGELIC